VDPKGLILLDTLYTYAAPTRFWVAIKKLGFDPKDVNITIVSHAHSDHDGGMKMMAGPRLAYRHGRSRWIDRGFSERVSRREAETRHNSGRRPGDHGRDTSVKIITTPGPTPGTLSFIFQIKDNGVSRTVAYSGGTAFQFRDEHSELRHLYQLAGIKWLRRPRRPVRPSSSRTTQNSDESNNQDQEIAAARPVILIIRHGSRCCSRDILTVTKACAEASKARLMAQPEKTPLQKL